MAAGKELSAPAQNVAPMSVTFEQMQRMAVSIAKSGLFGVKDPDQALSLMMIAQAEGKHPALVARDYHIIATDNGTRPAKKSEAMLRDFQAAGGKVEWHELSDNKADATFSHPQGGSIRLNWDLKRAEQAGLVGRKGDMYKKYARAMFRNRVISEGVRTIWPSATSGMYTPQEVSDIGEEEQDITPVSQTAAIAEVVQSATGLTVEEIEAHVNSMDVNTLHELQIAFEAAWVHGNAARDKAAKDRFKAAYDTMKADIMSRQPEGVPL